MDEARAVTVSSAGGTNNSEELAGRLRQRIVDLARKAGRVGLTINDAEEQIHDHKGHSVSPRFAELANRGALVRVLIGRGKPTKRFPSGAPRHFKRYDDRTHRSVIVHWAPGFAPSSEQNEPSDRPEKDRCTLVSDCERER